MNDFKEILKEKAEALNLTKYHAVATLDGKIKALQEKRRKAKADWSDDVEVQLEQVGEALKASFPERVVVCGVGNPWVGTVARVECSPRLGCSKNLQRKLVDPGWWYVQVVPMPGDKRRDFDHSLSGEMRLDLFQSRMSLLGDRTKVFTEFLPQEDIIFILMTTLRARVLDHEVNHALRILNGVAFLCHKQISLDEGRSGWTMEATEEVIEVIKREGWQAEYDKRWDSIRIEGRRFWINEAGERAYLGEEQAGAEAAA